MGGGGRWGGLGAEPSLYSHQEAQSTCSGQNPRNTTKAMMALLAARGLEAAREKASRPHPGLRDPEPHSPLPGARYWLCAGSSHSRSHLSPSAKNKNIPPHQRAGHSLRPAASAPSTVGCKRPVAPAARCAASCGWYEAACPAAKPTHAGTAALGPPQLGQQRPRGPESLD